MKNIIQAVVKFQSQVPTIPKNCVNPHYRSKYADLSSVVDVCMPHLNKNDLCIVQQFGMTNDERNTLVTRLYHSSGEVIESTIILPEIQDPQKLTGAVTYFRRCSYLSILGLVADDDDDGNSTIKQTQPKQDFKPTFNQNDVAGASEAQLNAVKKLYGKDYDVTNMTRNAASELIAAFNKGK